MKHYSAKIIILLSFLLHMNFIGFNSVFLQTLTQPVSITFFVFQAIAYLLYPFVGWLADVYFTRYRFVMCSFALVIIGALLMCIGGSIDLCIGNENNELGLSFLGGFCIVLFTIGFASFESTAIQFGMDQMIEENSDKLSSFIYWYCWASYFSRLVCITVYMGVMILLSKCVLNFSHFSHFKFVFMGTLFAVLAVVQLFCAFVGLCLLVNSKKHLNIDSKGYNPLKLMYQVLKYSWEHKVPQNRSAFTYWENDIPPRIDLGKVKYGGPFSNEEVEDTKTFFFLLLTICSLLGYQLSGYGYSVENQLLQQSCPPLWLLSIAGEPIILALLVVSIGVPLYQWIIVRHFQKYIPKMMKKIGLGLVCCLVKQIIEIVLQATMNVSECSSKEKSSLITCYVTLSETNINGTCTNGSSLIHTNCHVAIGLFPWLVASNILQGMSFLLVFVTFLEFICAQAPLQLKGLLIGLWYASLAVKCLLRIADLYTTDITSWRIYNGIKAGLILLSLLFYICVSKHYRYRERDEVVNEQYLVEEIYEKELNQVYEEEMRKRRRHVDEIAERKPLVLDISNSYDAMN